MLFRSREQPELPAAQVLSAEEIEAVYVQTDETLIPETPPTLRDVVRRIGSLGGHLGRKGDKEPGMIAFWRGWTAMYRTVIALRNYRRIRGLQGPS